MYIPLSELELPQPLSRNECAPPLPEPKGGGENSLAGGGGGVPIPTKEKELSTLSTLWIVVTEAVGTLEGMDTL